MKKIIVFVCVLVLPICLFATSFHSVPLGHEAYRIIEVAQLRGIIRPQSDVKPYNVDLVTDLLSTIADSDWVSASEKAEVGRVLAELESLYGDSADSSFLKSGMYTHVADGNVTRIGVKASSFQFAGLSDLSDKVLDSRNGFEVSVNGNIQDVLSYDLNFGASLNKIDIDAYLPTELKINCEGFYRDFLGGSGRTNSFPSDDFCIGIEYFPEISTSIKNGLFSARIGAVKRDWGPGVNNIALSASARVMDGFEFSLKPVSWFKYDVMVASLGVFSLLDVDGIDWPSDNMEDKKAMYNNNLSIHRAELGPFSNLKFSVWEACVWRKRFELSYLNPLAIYSFAQDGLGDYDNMIAGFDLTYHLPGTGMLYFAFSFDELGSPKKIFTCPRNMMTYQFGAKFAIPAFNFSELTAQVTYIPAFFGSHYAEGNKLSADVVYTTAYVNKGQNIGYPVNPDTLELLLRFNTTVADGWKIDLLLKSQLRSAQYATKQTGTDILTFMSYEDYYNGPGEWGQYYDRDFFGNIWNVIYYGDLTVEKKLENSPVTLVFGVRDILEAKRSFDPVVIPLRNYNPGKVSFTSDWSYENTILASLGVKVFY